MTVQEVAKRQGKSVRTVFRWINDGAYGQKLFVSRNVGRIEINEKTLESFLRRARPNRAKK